jgi:hypothetical protein
MRFELTVDYPCKGRSQRVITFEGTINHLRTKPEGSPRHQRKGSRGLGATTVAWATGAGKAVVAHSVFNPHDPSFSKKAGIITAISNYILRRYDCDGEQEAVLVEARREISDVFDGYRMRFVTKTQAADEGYLYEPFWWLTRRSCRHINDKAKHLATTQEKS